MTAVKDHDPTGALKRCTMRRDVAFGAMRKEINLVLDQQTRDGLKRRFFDVEETVQDFIDTVQNLCGTDFGGSK